MLKSVLPATRRNTLIGVGAVTLALGASLISAPIANAYVDAFVPVSPPTVSTSTGGEEIHETNTVPLTNEHISDWVHYEVTGEQEITFSVPVHGGSCNDVRAQVSEQGGALHVATVEGTNPNSNGNCDSEMRVVKLRVHTNALASTLDVRHMPSDQVQLHP